MNPWHFTFVFLLKASADRRIEIVEVGYCIRFRIYQVIISRSRERKGSRLFSTFEQFFLLYIENATSFICTCWIHCVFKFCIWHYRLISETRLTSGSTLFVSQAVCSELSLVDSFTAVRRHDILLSSKMLKFAHRHCGWVSGRARYSNNK